MSLLTGFYFFIFSDLQFQVTCESTMHFMYIRYYFFFTATSSFVQLKICMFLLIMTELLELWSLQCQASTPSLVLLCWYPSMLHLVSPVPKASSGVPVLYSSTLHYCAGVVNISFYSVTASYCFLYGTVVVPHKVK